MVAGAMVLASSAATTTHDGGFEESCLCLASNCPSFVILYVDVDVVATIFISNFNSQNTTNQCLCFVKLVFVLSC